MKFFFFYRNEFEFYFGNTGKFRVNQLSNCNNDGYGLTVHNVSNTNVKYHVDSIVDGTDNGDRTQPSGTGNTWPNHSTSQKRSSAEHSKAKTIWRRMWTKLPYSQKPMGRSLNHPTQEGIKTSPSIPRGPTSATRCSASRWFCRSCWRSIISTRCVRVFGSYLFLGEYWCG